MKKIILLITGLSLTSISIAALLPGGIAEGWTLTAITTLTSVSIGAISAFGTAFSASMQFNFERMISAIAIATKQEAVSANNVGEVAQKSAQVLISAIKSQNQVSNVAQTTFDYSPATGQGFEPCQTNKRNQTLDKAFVGISKNISSEMQNMDTDNRIGFVVDNVANSMGKRLEKHYKLFCTKAESDKGLCSESKLSGGDVNAAFLFEPALKNSDKDKARIAYIEHIMGEPDAPIMNENKQSSNNQAALIAKIQKDSLMSVPAYSLQAIRLANLQQENYHNYSPNQLLKARINQYFGGQEANKWAGTLATQTERGLLVEALKVHGLETWLHHKQYQQNQRLEANLATLILVNTQKTQHNLHQNYNKLIAQGE